MSIVDKSSHIPFYRQLAELLQREISVQQAQGSVYQLPSENELAERHGLSRATVRHALDELARDGWIYTQKGIGSFAPARRVEQDVTALVSTTEDMHRRGWQLATRVLDLTQIPAPPHVAQALNLPGGDVVFQLRRLRAVHSTPLSLQMAYLPAALCPHLAENDLTGSLYRLLEARYGLLLWTGRETLRARAANDEEAAWLDIAPHAAVMYAERITYGADGRAIEYLEAIWRGDLYSFNVTLTRP
jgi:GntR family transcriptional regulator